MSTRLTTGLLSCLLMSLLVGCATSPSLIRGQNPIPPAPASIDNISDVSTTASEELPFPHNLPPSQMMQEHVHHHSYGHPQYCPDCYKNGERPCWDGQKWCYRDGTPYWGWAPTHMYQHMYRIPQNIVYPQNPTPAAVTVYPYYTHKAPDDFFYTGD